MLIRPDRDDLRVIGFYLGKVFQGLGLGLLLPLVLALIMGEWNDASAIGVSASLGVIVGRVAEMRLSTQKPLDWSHGMVTVAVAWLIGPVFIAIPLYLSGHMRSFSAAWFDGMSGLTASGLTVLEDLDHLGIAMNILRHLAHFMGGQGIVIVVLTVFASGAARLSTLYVGEAREEMVVPNVIRTARFIYTIAFAWAVVGTTALLLAGIHAGLTPWRALFHGVNLFMSAFDTGGFSTTSASIWYYHSPVLETVVLLPMVAGALSFPIHFELWRRRARLVFEHLESRTLALTTTAFAVVTLLGLARAGTYTDAGSLYRKGVWTVLSASTNTGFTVIAPGTFISDWGLMAPATVVGAMALGAMAGSTAGGMKAIRIGLAGKWILRELRKAISPPSSLVVASYRGRRRQIISSGQVRAAIVIIVLYLLTYLGGALAGVFYGIPFEQALFESTSAGSNAGLSVGVVQPELPTPLLIIYPLQMYLGRLEFLAAFALVGYIVASFRGRT